MAKGDGLVTMTPTSVTATGAGSSATIASDGSVDFTSAETLSLNGVFASGFDNYIAVIRYKCSVNDVAFLCRVRAAGTDNSTASSYVSQSLNADGGPSPSGGRSTSNQGQLGVSGSGEQGRNIHFYGPFLAQPTAWRTVSAGSLSGAVISDNAVTHNQSTSYDGFSIYPGSGNITGNIAVFGYEE